MQYENNTAKVRIYRTREDAVVNRSRDVIGLNIITPVFTEGEYSDSFLDTEDMIRVCKDLFKNLIVE